jgi:hypothetical protein
MKGSSGYVYFIYYDANNKKIRDAVYYGFNGSKDWKKYVINGKTPKEAEKCSVMVRNFSPGKTNGTYFDALEFFSE